MSTRRIFKDFVKKAAEKFSVIPKTEAVRVVSHMDSDGISAASILLFSLTNLGYRYSISIVKQLDDETLDMLSAEESGCFFFTDLGSGQMKSVVSKMKGKKVFILDHHHPQSSDIVEDIIQVNPLLFGIDGSREISGSGVVYLFAKEIDPKASKISHLAVVGAIGDRQDKGGFKTFNKRILEEAISEGLIRPERKVRFFGTQTRPINKLLEYSMDPYIPGVTGNTAGTRKFLEGLGIEYESLGRYKKISQLTKDEMEKLISGIIEKRKDERNPKDIFGTVYRIVKEDDDSPLAVAREFSTLLNACGRMGKASLGIGACLGHKGSKSRAVELLKNYKREILEAMRWYESSKGSGRIFEGEGFMIIDSRTDIAPTLIGTLVSVLSYSLKDSGVKYVIGMSHNIDSTSKISIRYTGSPKDDVNLRLMIGKMTKDIGGNSGGHKLAAGAVIPIAKEKEFISKAKEYFGSRVS